MAKLTDTQLVILSAAAQRRDGSALPLAKSLKIKGAAVTKTLDGMRKKGLLEEKPASRAAVAWREDEDGRRMTLVVTAVGREAIDGGPAAQGGREPVPAGVRVDKTRTGQKPARQKTEGDAVAPAIRQGTKQALLIELLKRESGATIDEIIEATGWQAHSIRGAISGALKKKLGLTVSSEKVEGRGRVYRVPANA